MGSKPAQERTVKVMGTVTTAATMQRLGEPSRRPNLQAHTELSNDASRVLAFLQMHGKVCAGHDCCLLQDSLRSSCVLLTCLTSAAKSAYTLSHLGYVGSTGDTQPQGNVSPTIASRSTLYQQSFSETDRLHGSDRR